jgi:hypothetical protein
MEENKDNDISSVVFDLGANRRGTLNESVLSIFAAWVQYLLEKMFMGQKVPVKVRGNRLEVMRFTDTLVAEKRFIDAVKKYGLDSPLTFKNRSKLEKNIRLFEKETGIKWPVR